MKDEASLVLTPQILLHAYASGIFPMADSATSDDIYWVDPEKRGVIPLDGLKVSRSLAKLIRKAPYDIVIDRHFTMTVQACADRSETWINPEITALYTELHRRGHAHSVEIWKDGDLVGGLYGVAIGGAFFGESMFSRVPSASKIALVYLIARLRKGGFRLLDTQFVTEHLKSLGAIEITRKAYQKALQEALVVNANFWAMPRRQDAQSVLHLSTQTS